MDIESLFRDTYEKTRAQFLQAKLDDCVREWERLVQSGQIRKKVCGVSLIATADKKGEETVLDLLQTLHPKVRAHLLWIGAWTIWMLYLKEKSRARNTTFAYVIAQLNNKPWSWIFDYS